MESKLNRVCPHFYAGLDASSEYVIHELNRLPTKMILGLISNLAEIMIGRHSFREMSAMLEELSIAEGNGPDHDKAIQKVERLIASLALTTVCTYLKEDKKRWEE